MHSPDPDAVGSRHRALASNPAPEVVHKKGERSYRAQWWVQHTPGMEAFMGIGIHGQWIYIDRNHDVAIVKLGSIPPSKDQYLDSYNLEGFYGIVKYLSKR